MFDGFLQLAGLTGETKDAEFTGKAFEILSFDFGSTEDLAQAAATRDAARKQAQAEQMKQASMKKGQGTIVAAKEKREDEHKFSFEVTKYIDSSSPHLFLSYFSASVPTTKKVFATATIYLRKTGAVATKSGETFIKFEFQNVCVVGYELEADDGDLPVETVTCSFDICTMEYRSQLTSGSLNSAPIVLGWDHRQHKPV